MGKLWEKNYSQNKEAEAYSFGDNVVLDNKLVVQDALGSIAHAKMLVSIGILSSAEFTKLRQCLLKIIKLNYKGQFKVEFGDEDVHTKIENYLVQKLGDIGKKIHTGRSRNDQVQVDLRLFTKDNLLDIASICNKLIDSFINFALRYEFVSMPGYTHMQKAMPSSVGMWAGSFAESLIDDLELLKSAYIHNDQSPLGSGAAYGVSLPIDRDLTSKLLGFAKVQNNSLYAQVSRGKSHLSVMQALTQIMLTLSRFAQDLLIFTTAEFNFFSVDQELSTGSSIMPQKKNLDVMEILRGRTQIIISQEQSVASIIAGLPSGFNADFAETKYSFMKSIEITNETLKICNLVVKSIKPNIEILKKACTPEIYATHAAYQFVNKGISFRDAYKKVGLSLEKLPKFDPVDILKASSHIGGPGNLQLKKISIIAKQKHNWWENKYKNYLKKIKNLGRV